MKRINFIQISYKRVKLLIVVWVIYLITYLSFLIFENYLYTPAYTSIVLFLPLILLPIFILQLMKNPTSINFSVKEFIIKTKNEGEIVIPYSQVHYVSIYSPNTNSLTFYNSKKEKIYTLLPFMDKDIAKNISTGLINYVPLVKEQSNSVIFLKKTEKSYPKYMAS